jgi:cob(I)alamin adenosyltransferase
MAIRIDRVVTRGGDGGETSLGNGARVPKNHLRVAAYGAVDEANAALGVLRLQSTAETGIDSILARIQNDLFDIGADLCVPGEAGGTLRIDDRICLRLDQEIAALNADLPPLTSFVLPGGNAGSAYAHLARTILRRAERAVVALSHDEAVNPHIIASLNRMSDALFVIGRVLNDKVEKLWIRQP